MRAVLVYFETPLYFQCKRLYISFWQHQSYTIRTCCTPSDSTCIILFL